MRQKPFLHWLIEHSASVSFELSQNDMLPRDKARYFGCPTQLIMLPKTMYLEVQASFCGTMAASLETGTDSVLSVVH